MCLAIPALVTGCSEESKTSTQPETKSQQPQSENSKSSQASETITHSQNIDIWPTLDIEVKKDAEIEAKVEALLAKMTLEQKVAQMIQPEIRDITVEDMRRYGFGSYLNGGGAFPNNDKHATPQDWIDLAESLYQASMDDSLDGISIPTMWGTDAVHGHNNVIGATLFPHNIGLGAANNPDLIEKIAHATAKEVMATGIDWVFAPTVAVVRDDRWGRSYEGYSEDPEIVRAYSKAIVHGLQGFANKDFLSDSHVISSVKHFLGDGGTEGGDDQGDNLSSEQDLFDIHAQGYVGGLTAGAQTVMASFNSWHGDKVHGNKYLLTDVLKDRMGFDGFVVGDWNGHGQVAGCTNWDCPQSVNAGLDMYMVPTDAWKPLLENTIAHVKSGVIPQSRIDDAVTRILRVKFRAGLFDKPSPANRQYSGKVELIGAPEHREIARQAVRESLVLLKNKGNILPLSPNQNVLVAGDCADNIGKQAGGWSITWQGTGNQNSDFPGETSIYQGIADEVNKAGGNITLSEDGSFTTKPDVAIVVFGEEPYAEGNGDIANLNFERGDKKSLALLNKFKSQGIPVVSLFISGRPMWVNAELNASDAFVAVWLPGSEGQGIADVILTDAAGKVKHDFKGTLTFSWPQSAAQTVVNRHDEDYDPLLPYGFGLRYGNENVLADNLSEAVEQADDALTSMPIFKGSIKKPWRLNLFSENNSIEVSQNSQQLGALSFRTTDRRIQEDAFKLTLDGSARAGVQMNSNFTQDLRALLEAKAQLVFSVNLSKRATAKVELSMYCDSGEKCDHSIDLTQQLNALPLNEWQTLTVDLACFKDNGVNFNHLNVPFELATSGELEVILSDVAIEQVPSEAKAIQCR